MVLAWESDWTGSRGRTRSWSWSRGRSRRRLQRVGIVALLLLRFGSKTPFGAVTVAVSEILPARR